VLPDAIAFKHVSMGAAAETKGSTRHVRLLEQKEVESFPHFKHKRP